MACCVLGREGEAQLSPNGGDTFLTIDGMQSLTHNLSFDEIDNTSIGDAARGYCRGLRDESIDIELNMCDVSAAQIVMEELLYNTAGEMPIRWRYTKKDGAPWYYGTVIPTDASVSMSVEDQVTRSFSLRLNGGSPKLVQPY